MQTPTVAVALLACGALLSPLPVESFSRPPRNAVAGRSPPLLLVHRSLPTRLFSSGPSDDDDGDAGTAASDADTQVLETMLLDFLANSHKQSAHDRFWADDLVYTSSGGTRLTREAIMSSFDGITPNDDDETPPDVIFTPEEVDVRVHGDAAIVAFKLKGDDGSTPMFYYNTGTFLKRGGTWRAAAWHSTEIPASQ